MLEGFVDELFEEIARRMFYVIVIGSFGITPGGIPFGGIPEGLVREIFKFKVSA